MRNTQWSARAALSLLACLGMAGVGTHAAAQGAPAGTVTLDTLVLEVRAPSNELRIGRMRGTGSMDPVIAQVSPTKLLIADTASVTYNGDSGTQGMLTLVELTKDGPKVVGQQLLPREDGERVHMKMNVVPLDYKSGNQLGATKSGATEVRALITYATEDNQGDNGNGRTGPGSLGSNNGNPQTVAWVVKISDAKPAAFKAGPMTIAEASTTSLQGVLTPLRKINTVSLTGNQDGQQYGAESVICQGDVCSLALQRNNQTTNVSRFSVNADGTMTRLTQRRTNNQNGQHSRPVFARDFNGREFEAIVDTNDQPARAIRLWEQNPESEATVKSKQLLRGNDDQKLYVSRPYAAAIRELSPDLNPAAEGALKDKAPVFVFSGVVTAVRNRGNLGGDNQNGHGGGATRTLLMALDPNTFEPFGQSLPNIAQLPPSTEANSVMSGAAPYGRHASMLVANAFGPIGKALPAAVLLGASSTGSAPGYAQFIPYDPSASKFEAKTTRNRFALGFADIANQTKGKRNPQNQAGAFLGGVTDVVNPFYGDPTSKQPEVKAYTVVPVSGAFNIQGATADTSMGLRVSFIPQVWAPDVAAKAGNAKPVDSVPNGPSPVATGGTGAAGPQGVEAKGDTDDTVDEGTGTGLSSPQSPSGQLRPTAESGCSVAKLPSGGDFAAVLFGLSLSVLVLRRKKGQ